MSYGYPPQGGDPSGGYGQGGGYGYGGQGGYGQGGDFGGQRPSNYLAFAIIMILCCWPLAIPAIIFSTQVNSKYQAGDYAGAEEASKKAKMFSFIALGAGIVWVIIWVILSAAGIFAVPTSGGY